MIVQPQIEQYAFMPQPQRVLSARVSALGRTAQETSGAICFRASVIAIASVIASMETMRVLVVVIITLYVGILFSFVVVCLFYVPTRRTIRKPYVMRNQKNAFRAFCCVGDSKNQKNWFFNMAHSDFSPVLPQRNAKLFCVTC